MCFADLVGFTRLGAEVEVQELGTSASRLAELAGEVAVAPVRLVKTIGDAAMFVSREVPPLVDAALSLVAAAERTSCPPCGPASPTGRRRCGPVTSTEIPSTWPAG